MGPSSGSRTRYLRAAGVWRSQSARPACAASSTVAPAHTLAGQGRRGTHARHALRPLREQVELVLRRARHDVEHARHELVRHLVVEEVAHEAHVHAARLGPVQRPLEQVLVRRHREAVGVPLLPHAAQPPRHALGPAVRAPRADLGAAGGRVPALLGPARCRGSCGRPVRGPRPRCSAARCARIVFLASHGSLISRKPQRPKPAVVVDGRHPEGARRLHLGGLLGLGLARDLDDEVERLAGGGAGGRSLPGASPAPSARAASAPRRRSRTMKSGM